VVTHLLYTRTKKLAQNTADTCLLPSSRRPIEQHMGKVSRSSLFFSLKRMKIDASQKDAQVTLAAEKVSCGNAVHRASVDGTERVCQFQRL